MVAFTAVCELTVEALGRLVESVLREVGRRGRVVRHVVQEGQKKKLSIKDSIFS